MHASDKRYIRPTLLFSQIVIFLAAFILKLGKSALVKVIYSYTDKKLIVRGLNAFFVLTNIHGIADC
ncbi:MAG: hypothetical protein V7K50_08220 [Nostoc sp.]|uniref:hypothetical protein n=1 Tax=Nostoc sp. TaxID=1180 RepID=UPI002FF7A082